MRLSTILLVSFACTALPGLALSAQSNAPNGTASVKAIPQPPAAAPDPDGSLRLTVQVNTKHGEPVTSLQAADFTLLDNNVPRPLTSFRVVTPAQQPVTAILVFDAVNASFENLAYERTQIEPFLRKDGGQLPIPFTVATLTDTGVQMMKGSSRDGNALSQAIESNAPGLREITRRAGVWGADERLDISLKAISQVVAYAAQQPGRKLIFWVSPGWPLLSGPGIQLDARQQGQIFSNIVAFSHAMRRANVTLYSLNPLGVGESLVQADYYQGFLNGISRPSQTSLADLSVQVLALQSGGLTLNSTAIGDMLRKSLADAQSWYELTFDPAPAEHPDEYHHLQIKLERRDLTARTRDGYYALPTPTAH